MEDSYISIHSIYDKNIEIGKDYYNNDKISEEQYKRLMQGNLEKIRCKDPIYNGVKIIGTYIAECDNKTLIKLTKINSGRN